MNKHAFGASLSIVDGKGSHGGWEVMEFSDVGYLVVADIEIRASKTELVPAEGLTEFHLLLAGKASMSPMTTALQDESADDLKMIACRLGEGSAYRVTCPTGIRRSIGLYVRDAYIDGLLSSGDADFRRLRRQLQSVEPTQIYLDARPMAATTLAIARQLLHNPYEDSRRLVYAQSKVGEMLCEILPMFARRGVADPLASPARPADARLFENARDILCGRLHEPLTISELAKTLGTNPSKLCAGFRRTYGTTIQQYRNDARMRLALIMVSEQQASVQGTAHAVGYAHPSTFTTAFTRHFGCTPKRARSLRTHKNSK